MKRRKKISVEIMPRPATADMNAILDRIIQNRLDEILSQRGSDDQLTMGNLDRQPREISNELRQHRSMFERVKGRMYFETYGCKVCGRKKKVSHGSNGCCRTCVHRIYQRERAIKQEYDAQNDEAVIADNIDRLTRRARSAMEV